MLLFSDEEEIILLPALPDSWKSGSVKGLRGVGNIIIDIFWKNGKITEYKITALSDIGTVVKYGQEYSTALSMKAGETRKFEIK